MAKKSSFVRFGKGMIHIPGQGDEGIGGKGAGGKGADGKEQPKKPEGGETPAPGGSRNRLVIVLVIVCLALAVGLLLVYMDSADAHRMLKLRNEVGSLRLQGMMRFEEEKYASARKSFEEALKLARQYEFESAEGEIAAVILELEALLKRPAIARGKSGALAEKRTELRKLITELEPIDIYMQLGEKAGSICAERLKDMNPDELAELAPELIEEIISQTFRDLDEKGIVNRLGAKLNSIFQKRVGKMTVASLRSLLAKRLGDLVKSELARREYDADAMAELLGEKQADVAKGFIERAQPKDLAELLEPRFDDIERAMAERIHARRARITLDDGSVWEGQILHEGEKEMRFLKNDGSLFSIPKSKIKKIERLGKQEDPDDK